MAENLDPKLDEKFGFLYYLLKMGEDEIRQGSDLMVETYPNNLPVKLNEECVNFKELAKALALD